MKTFQIVFTTGTGNQTLQVQADTARKALRIAYFQLAYASTINTISAITLTTL